MQEIFLSPQDDNFNLCESKIPQNKVDDKTMRNNRTIYQTVFSHCMFTSHPQRSATGRGAEGCERVPHIFALDNIKTWLRSHRCNSDTQIRTVRQKSKVKWEYPVWKFLLANAHFIRTTSCSLPFVWCGNGVSTPLSLALHPWPQEHEFAGFPWQSQSKCTLVARPCWAFSFFFVLFKARCL